MSFVTVRCHPHANVIYECSVGTYRVEPFAIVLLRSPSFACLFRGRIRGRYRWGVKRLDLRRRRSRQPSLADMAMETGSTYLSVRQSRDFGFSGTPEMAGC